jgi:glycerophosphoryl diester phosphodiesterase
MQRPLLLGHRGARAVRSIQENSLLSFDRALSDGCDGFEFDVRLTADREAVIWHDEKFKGLPIARSSAEDLSGLARLEQVLERYQQTAFLDIELKVPGLEELILWLLKKHPPERGFVVSSFLPKVLRNLRERRRQLPLGLICETQAELRQWKRIDVEYVIPQYKLVNALLIQKLKAAGKKILVWTVNPVKQMGRFADAGVDGIISDDTELLAKLRP